VNVNLAIWFHDCVYDPRSTKNEEDSVKVFEDFAKCIKAFANELVEEARIAILLSKDHVRALKDMSTPEWMRVFLELDLSILASDSTRYAEYKTRIRQEYFHLADEAFRSGRRRFLEGVSNFRFMNVSNKDVLNTAFAKNIEVEISELS
jgi:predicted metal-dependent HD superfamily phosphohydrolase